ncbi:hypothetical protein SK128_007610 [Halocaridina rubra]|uniref:RNI-like protein n=1 Tax=Halocaridina rubra TaxID=373956 RepID=A0AAN9ACD3_HALRR
MTDSRVFNDNNKESNSWQKRAPRKDPHRLKILSQFCIARAVAKTSLTNFSRYKGDIRKIARLLKASLVLDLRTSLINEIVNTQENFDEENVKSLILLQLLTDVRHFSFDATISKTGCVKELDLSDSEELFQEIREIQELSLESFKLVGVRFEKGLVREILSRSPRVHSIHVGGDLSSEILSYVAIYPCELKSLYLDNCKVTDGEVVTSLLRTKTNFLKLGRMICGKHDMTDIENTALHSLQSITIRSPLLTGCGTILLLHVLRNLRNIHYTSWNSSIFETLILINILSPQNPTFALTSMDVWRPNEEALTQLKHFCPNLQKLMIECYDPELQSLQKLSKFTNLTTLILRLVSEELIISAVKAAGENLKELEIEFETFTFHSISLGTMLFIHEKCPNLQKFNIRHVCIESRPSDRLPSLRSKMFPNLKHLSLSSAVIKPAILERLIIGNDSLENLTLDVNHDALTDKVIRELQINNQLRRLKSISLGAGSLSHKVLTSLITLPELKTLSLDLKRFPFIPVSKFNGIKNELVKARSRTIRRSQFGASDLAWPFWRSPFCRSFIKAQNYFGAAHVITK